MRGGAGLNTCCARACGTMSSGAAHQQAKPKRPRRSTLTTVIGAVLQGAAVVQERPARQAKRRRPGELRGEPSPSPEANAAAGVVVSKAKKRRGEGAVLAVNTPEFRARLEQLGRQPPRARTQPPSVPPEALSKGHLAAGAVSVIPPHAAVVGMIEQNSTPPLGRSRAPFDSRRPPVVHRRWDRAPPRSLHHARRRPRQHKPVPSVDWARCSWHLSAPSSSDVASSAARNTTTSPAAEIDDDGRPLDPRPHPIGALLAQVLSVLQPEPCSPAGVRQAVLSNGAHPAFTLADVHALLAATNHIAPRVGHEDVRTDSCGTSPASLETIGSCTRRAASTERSGQFPAVESLSMRCVPAARQAGMMWRHEFSFHRPPTAFFDKICGRWRCTSPGCVQRFRTPVELSDHLGSIVHAQSAQRSRWHTVQVCVCCGCVLWLCGCVCAW